MASTSTFSVTFSSAPANSASVSWSSVSSASSTKIEMYFD